MLGFDWLKMIVIYHRTTGHHYRTSVYPVTIIIACFISIIFGYLLCHIYTMYTKEYVNITVHKEPYPDIAIDFTKILPGEPVMKWKLSMKRLTDRR
jgi:hypothetical protein